MTLPPSWSQQNKLKWAEELHFRQKYYFALILCHLLVNSSQIRLPLSQANSSWRKATKKSTKKTHARNTIRVNPLALVELSMLTSLMQQKSALIALRCKSIHSLEPELRVQVPPGCSALSAFLPCCHCRASLRNTHDRGESEQMRRAQALGSLDVLLAVLPTAAAAHAGGHFRTSFAAVSVFKSTSSYPFFCLFFFGSNVVHMHFVPY